MDILSASVLSGLIFDGAKAGATIGFDMLKSKLQGWLIDDTQIEQMVEQLREADINEDLALHVIERKITEHQPLLNLIQQIHVSDDKKIVIQTSKTGLNINNSGSGNISVGSIINSRGSE